MEEPLLQIWRLTPLVLLFVSGYLVYRILAVHKVTDLIAVWFVKRSLGKTPLLFLYILIGTAVLSFFISNTIAVLTLLPILKAIRNDYELLGFKKAEITTILTVPLMYGANIGGMGSLIGGPSHLILLGTLEVMNIPGREQISFGTWFLWSLPMTAIFIIAAWLLTLFFIRPRSLITATITLDALNSEEKPSVVQRQVIILFFVFIAFWSVIAIAVQMLQLSQDIQTLSAILFFILFIHFVLIRRSESAGGIRCLPVRLLFSGIPPRLYLFIGIFIGIILVVQILSLDTMTVGFFTDLIGDDAPLFLTYLLLVFIVMILTEFFSNTVVATAFMPVAATLALTTGGNPLAMMIAVSCACTCTFMTPIATPSNALAFAEMDGISLKKMMLIGIIMNVVAALIMSAYLPGAVEMVYGG